MLAVFEVNNVDFFFQIIIFCCVVAICDLVHDMETIHDLRLLLTSSWNLLEKI